MAIAEKLWNLEKPPLYGKPIGFPLILTPFVGYFQNANIFLMGDIISTINSFIINTGSILLLFGIALYITKKNAISFGIACIYIIMPWVYTTYRVGEPQSLEFLSYSQQFSGFSIFHIFEASGAFDILLYQVSQWLGITTLSDTLGVALLLLSIFLLLSSNISPQKRFVAGLILGYSCTLRIIYVVVIPCFLLWQFKQINSKKKWKDIFLFFSAISLGISPQILENIWLTGSPFLTPYSLQSLPIKFDFSYIPFGAMFLTTLHYSLFFFSSLAVFFYKNNPLRFIFSSFILVYFLFLSGYSYATAEEIRYIYPCLIFMFLYLGITCSHFIFLAWQNKNKYLLGIIFISVFHFLWITPINSSTNLVSPALLQHYPITYISLACIITFLLGLRYANLLGGIIATIILILYLSGIWIIPCIGIICSSIWAIYKEIKN